MCVSLKLNDDVSRGCLGGSRRNGIGRKRPTLYSSFVTLDHTPVELSARYTAADLTLETGSKCKRGINICSFVMR